MSQVSGRCDLLDTISMMGELSQKEDERCIKCDMYKGFKKFKEATKGIIHQFLKVYVTLLNQDFIAQKCSNFKVIEHTKQINDKRYKNGFREEKYYTYEYYNKPYNTLKELNKNGVYIQIDIKFNTIVELIPYFPYTIAVQTYDKENECMYVGVSNESYIDREYKESIKCGWDGSWMYYHYRKQLAELTREIVLNEYGDYKERIVSGIFPIIRENDKRIIKFKYPIDTDWDVTIKDTSRPFMVSSPIVLDEYTLDVTNTYTTDSLTAAYVTYVRKREEEKDGN